MKIRNIILYTLITAAISLSCKRDLQFDNPRTLTTDEAFKVKGAGVKLANSSVLRAINSAYAFGGVHINELADQITTTNRYTEFWDFAQEPRVPLNNSESYGGYAYVIASFYSSFYQANLDANQILNNIDAGNKVIDANGNDRTSDTKIAALLTKGISQGYLGAIYDRGVIVDGVAPTNLPTDFPNSYKELIANGVKYIDQAIASANSASAFNFDFILGQTLSKADFLQLANSFAARIMASQPRDLSEAKALGATYWNKVYDYASKGFMTDLLNNYQPGGFYNETLDWGISLLSDGSGYLPVDIKVPWLADKTGTYPNYYPSGTTILGPVQTDDKRFDQYFGYTPNFGYLRADRNRGLFTNYYRIRWDNPSNTISTSGAINPIFLAEEIRLLMAEAKMFAGDATAAAALLNLPTAKRKSVGQLPDVAATEAAVRNAIFYEYSIEIDVAAGIIPVWAFMRRNDKLIGGTATELPIPSQQLNVLKLPLYTFGGKANMGAKGKFGETTTAANVGWKSSE